jgi:hypothetical protein
MKLGRPADGFSGQILCPRYCRKIFIINFFKAIFIIKIEHIYAIRRDVPGSKVSWPVLPNHKFSARGWILGQK